MATKKHYTADGRYYKADGGYWFREKGYNVIVKGGIFVDFDAWEVISDAEKAKVEAEAKAELEALMSDINKDTEANDEDA